MRISDWSSDVCSSDLVVCLSFCWRDIADGFEQTVIVEPGHPFQRGQFHRGLGFPRCPSMDQLGLVEAVDGLGERSEEHTSELQSLMRISYAVFCLKKKKSNYKHNNTLPKHKKQNKHL